MCLSMVTLGMVLQQKFSDLVDDDRPLRICTGAYWEPPLSQIEYFSLKSMNDSIREYWVDSKLGLVMQQIQWECMVYRT